MKICIAQTKPIKGDIEQNLNRHIQFINNAISYNADLIIFPELSLSGYEPTLARQLATTKTDERLNKIQELSDINNIIIGVGLPTIDNNDIFISMIIFQPHKERISYSKQFLYPSEKEIFKAGHTPVIIKIDDDHIIAPAICYELSNEAHAENAYQKNATIYIASVLNSVNGVDADIIKLSAIAKKYKMMTFMSNFIGQSGEYDCAGKSSIWNEEGILMIQMDDKTEGILIFDTKTKETLSVIFDTMDAQ